MNDEHIRQFLERYGQALSAGEMAEIVGCWAVPALVLADEGALAVAESGQVAQFFERAIGQYHAQGLMTTQPMVEQVEMLTDRLASVDVRWTSFDAAGAERTNEHSHYILWLSDDGQLRIRVALTRPA
jgi:hypothetical protein